MTDPSPIIFRAVMATLMSFAMSGIVTAINLGITPGFVSDWMSAWATTGPIAFVGVMLVAPLATRITTGIVRLLPRRHARRDRTGLREAMPRRRPIGRPDPAASRG